MQKLKISKKKIRVVGLLDVIITSALIFQLVYCRMHALILEQEEIDSKHQFKVFLPPNYRPIQATEESRNFWVWPFIGICVYFGFIPILAGFALVMSTSPNTELQKAYEITKLWMYCNIFTFTLACFNFVVLSLIHIFGYGVELPILTLIYLACRCIFTRVIRRQLDIMAFTLDTKSTEEKQALCQNKNHPTTSDDELLDVCVTKQPSAQPLTCNANEGMHVENCQCEYLQIII